MFKPVLSNDNGVYGWFIGCESWRLISDHWTFDSDEPGVACVFHRRVDCEMAIRAFAAEGITTDDQMLATTNEQMREIAYGSLAW